MIRLSQLKADKVLQTLLKDHGVEIPIYIRELPSSGLPEEFIWIVQNGRYQNMTLDKSIYNTTLAVQTEVKLTSTQTVNYGREDLLVESIENIIGNIQSIIIDDAKSSYTYLYLDGRQLTLEGRPLVISNIGLPDKYKVVFGLSNNAVYKSAYLQATYSRHTTNINVQLTKIV